MGHPRQTHEHGFTIVELMVVVLILGVLVAIAIPVYNASAATVRLRTCFSNQRTIEGAVQMYRAAGNEMWSQPHRLNGNGTADTCDLLVPGYIKTAPQCPTTDDYYYVDAGGRVLGDRGVVPAFTPGHTHY